MTQIRVVCDVELEDIIPGYLESRRDESMTIRALVDAGEFEEIRVIAHGMKGSGGCYGFDIISTIGSDMETAAKNSSRDDVSRQIDLLEAYLNSIDVCYE